MLISSRLPQGGTVARIPSAASRHGSLTRSYRKKTPRYCLILIGAAPCQRQNAGLASRPSVSLASNRHSLNPRSYPRRWPSSTPTAKTTTITANAKTTAAIHFTNRHTVFVIFVATGTLLSSHHRTFETEIAHRPSRDAGISLRFSTCFIPERMSIVYGPVQVKALAIGFFTPPPEKSTQYCRRRSSRPKHGARQT